MTDPSRTRSGKPLESQPNNPLHGVKLADMLLHLEEKLGWSELGDATGIKVMHNRPTHKSILSFLRRTPWARDKVESLYLAVTQNRYKPRRKNRSTKSQKSQKFPFLTRKK